MTDHAKKERQRLAAQQDLDGLRSCGERNRLGQFATPPALAEDILRFAHSLVSTVKFLDPAVGTGAFYSALRRVFEPERIQLAMGVELDPAFAEAARRIWQETGLEVDRGDFTELQPRDRFNLLVANPPYVRHHHLNTATKARLQARVRTRLGIRLNGLAGLYCYFVLLADEWLDEGALSIWLIPSEFMDVNYGHALKQYLTENVRLLHVHRFNPEDVQFTDALVTSAIVAFLKEPPSEADEVRFSIGGSLADPGYRTNVCLAKLRQTRKWTSLAAPSKSSAPVSARVTLGDLFAIRRGIATGANSFFILGEENARRAGIPPEFLRPILPGPRSLPVEIVEADSSGMPSNVTRLVLLDCEASEEEVRSRYPRFWQYLERGKAERVHTSYLASRRNPWYAQERRDPPPFLYTYMGRSATGKGPFRVVWNKSRATAHNVYLLLYPKPALAKLLDLRPELQETVFENLRSIDTGLLVGQGRVYGGGLHKLEPAELARVPAEELWKAVTRGDHAPLPFPGPRQLALGL